MKQETKRLPSLETNLSSKMLWWFTNVLVILLFSVIGLSRQLQQFPCSTEGGPRCLGAVAEALMLFPLLFPFALAWHAADFATDRLSRPLLRIIASPMLFSVSLVAFVGLFFAQVATTSINEYGYYESPIGIKVASLASAYWLLALVIAKLSLAAVCLLKAGMSYLRRLEGGVEE